MGRNENQWLALKNVTRFVGENVKKGTRAIQKFTGTRKENSFKPRWGELGIWLSLLRWTKILHKNVDCEEWILKTPTLISAPQKFPQIFLSRPPFLPTYKLWFLHHCLSPLLNISGLSYQTLLPLSLKNSFRSCSDATYGELQNTDRMSNNIYLFNNIYSFSASLGDSGTFYSEHSIQSNCSRIFS